MSATAVIQLAGKQYLVSEGATITTNRLEQNEGETVKVSDVLLVTSDKNTLVGTPLVEGASVTLTVQSNNKGDKIKVFKFKSKSRYRKTQGHRQLLSTLLVNTITIPKAR
ncbi:50S ribosomal protein L21 [Candidatus Woesebacteria bacterium]|nr:50S ribosomal protein L21 [Candidatus Woesebacteria bacterium]